jgi:hypothetical protein
MCNLGGETSIRRTWFCQTGRNHTKMNFPQIAEDRAKGEGKGYRQRPDAKADGGGRVVRRSCTECVTQTMHSSQSRIGLRQGAEHYAKVLDCEAMCHFNLIEVNANTIDL